jgi:DNA-directed RNA polymerase specialized sigma24 family protein
MSANSPLARAESFQLQLAAARNGDGDAFGRLLKRCERNLLHIMHGRIAADLQAKAGSSDLIQETFLEAQRDFHCFAGTTEAELSEWLRQTQETRQVSDGAGGDQQFLR